MSSFKDDIVLGEIKDKALKTKLEESIKRFKVYKPGDFAWGTIAYKDDQMLLVDIGARAEGIIDGRELKAFGKKELKKLKEGDKLLVYVVSPEARDGSVVLSIQKAKIYKDWLDLEEAKEKGKTLTVKVVEVNSGGLICELPSGIRGFVPLSQIDPTRIFDTAKKTYGKDVMSEVQKKLAHLLDQEIKVKVLEVNKEKGKVIFSEKAVVFEDKLGIKPGKKLKKLVVGQVLDGVVTAVTPFGIFVNAGGYEGLVHVSELSWDKVTDISKLYKIGDKVKVMVLEVADGGKRVAFSIKRLTPDPWKEKIKKYKVGDVVEGVVEGIVDFGAFVRIEEGINGLIHISELSNKLVKHPRDIVKVGQKVKVLILSISETSRHLSLSLKRVDQKTGEVIDMPVKRGTRAKNEATVAKAAQKAAESQEKAKSKPQDEQE